MAKILVVCPYDGLGDLKSSIRNFSDKGDLVFSDKDIVAITDNAVYIGQSAEKHDINSFTGAFIRYPYDLIDQHASNYQKREYTEFVKSLALLFADIDFNNIKKAHFVRNRFYSLKKARECGLKTPDSFLLRKKKVDIGLSFELVSKSLGNCYFSETLPEVMDEETKKVLSFETDGGETAYIYSPHIVSLKNDLDKRIGAFGSCFLQNVIKGKEYRVFLVEDHVFVYERGDTASVDKSSANLNSVEGKMFEKYENKLQELRKSFDLRYLCLDVIYNKDFVVLDINPFGSFPLYKKYPEVTDTLSRLLLGKRVKK
jgi:hypothetical protein